MASRKERPQYPLRLFDRLIIKPGGKRSLVSQVHEILVEEIRAGRWRAGERLPGVTTLSEQTGLSRSPLQRAFERLREEGYLRQAKGAGSFLLSTRPDGVASFDTVGVALSLDNDADRWQSDHRVAGRLLAITEVAPRHGRLLEIRYLRAGDDWASLDRVGGLFGANVKGVISLHPFHHCGFGPELESDRLPFVHWGVASSDCLPVIAADDENGFYRLTRRVIEAGHRRIVFLADPDALEREREDCFRGHRRAMREARLDADCAAAEESLALEPEDLAGIQRFLVRHGRATAIVCARYSLSRAIVAAAELMGLRVPEDLSIAVVGHALMRRSDPSRRFCRLDFQRECMASLCFDLLEQQARTRKRELSRLLLNAAVCEGESLGPPRGAAPKAAEAAGPLRLATDRDCHCSSDRDTRSRRPRKAALPDFQIPAEDADRS
ncbi:MAG: Arabinose metabolism transcriptional repressor [candidate division BRC1 bacterium ADurb.BinA364]|nr:MAG: Arabinose metabolism transcriptional repressor [candidate division BRC1 bacterium ADurb.BinA364]